MAVWSRLNFDMSGVRPELQGVPQDVYTADEAARYHVASASIQKDLTRLAMELLQLPVSHACLMCCTLCD